MIRPTNLPAFENPPLHEVVVGVQFAPIKGYSQINIGDVWALYKDDYPLTEAHSPLAPKLANYGLQVRQNEVQFIDGAIHDRFWFLTRSEGELIQFQPDKFLHNWRKTDLGNNEYPRYEAISKKFETELLQLELYFKRKFKATGLNINHYEVSYVNTIYEKDLEGLNLNDIFSFVKFSQFPDNFATRFNRVLKNKTEQPYARLSIEVNQGVGPGGPLYKLSISVEGAPEDSSIKSAMGFIEEGRSLIVKTFKDVTGEKAHKVWRLKNE